MMLLAVTSLCLLVYARLCLGQISPPFQVTVLIEGNTDHSLQCETLAGFTINEAVFYRNGIQENTTDDCVPASHNGMLAFNNTPECDGHYYCGKIENNGVILSGPKTVLGEPQAITATPLSRSTCMGCTVIIPSNLRISAIGSQMVTWSVAKKGDITVLHDTMTDADHNLILVNAQKTDEGTYYATGSNNEGSENGAAVTLAVAEEPVIEGDIAYMEMDGLVHFSIDARGDELKYQWKINGSESLILSVSDNDSAIITDQLPLGTTQVSVKVSNDIGSDLRTIVVVNTSNSESEDLPVYCKESIFVSMSVIIVVLGLFLCALPLSCGFYLVWNRGRDGSESSRKNSVLLGDEPDCVDESQLNREHESAEFNLKSQDIGSLGWELRQLLAKKLSTLAKDCDESYEQDILHLIIIMQEIRGKKKIPHVEVSQTSRAIENDGQEDFDKSYPVLDNIPRKFHNIILTHCTEVGISWTGFPDVQKRNTMREFI